MATTITPALLSVTEVAAYLGISRSTVDRLRGRGRFPAPVSPPGVAVNRWRLRDIERYADGLVTRRRKGA